MKNALFKYIQNLSAKGIDSVFASTINKYGKITIYCLSGPKDNIIHVAFTEKKHGQAKKKLTCIDDTVEIRDVPQKDFQHDKIFEEYFMGKLNRLPINADSPFIEGGTPFQQKVWRQIAAIPYGECITYQQLAERAGSPKGARPAGMACGANPLPIIIPCHRVVASNGLGGFGGGIALKKVLLALEHAGNF